MKCTMTLDKISILCRSEHVLVENEKLKVQLMDPIHELQSAIRRRKALQVEESFEN